MTVLSVALRAPRPHVTVYNEISLDGKVTGFDGDGVRYYRRGSRWHSDAILMGSVTARAFGPQESGSDQQRTLPPLPAVDLPPGFAELVYRPRPLLVVPDSAGQLRNWRHASAQPWYGRIVVLVATSTPADYIDYLHRRGIDHLCVGTDRVDLAAALRGLREAYAVQSIRTDGGGALNGALLTAGVVDRIAVIITPALSDDPDAQVLVSLPRTIEPAPRLTLVESEVLEDGALWLVYDVQHPE